jgi:excisionase family DNA binding protein
MMTLAEAAAILSLSPDTLRRQAQRGKLKGRKYGKTWVVTPREVERYRVENKRDLLPLS